MALYVPSPLSPTWSGSGLGLGVGVGVGAGVGLGVGLGDGADLDGLVAVGRRKQLQRCAEDISAAVPLVAW
jgi:hypothetical protein